MSEQDQAPGAKQSKKGPDCYVSPFASVDVPPAAKALRALFPPGTPHAVLVSFFQHRVTHRAVRMWRAGDRNPPQWALDLLRQHGEQFLHCIDTAKAGDPQKAGQLALHEYRKKRRALSA